MDRFEDYPPNPTGMEEELYKDGVNVLYSLIKNDGQKDDTEMNHIDLFYISDDVQLNESSLSQNPLDKPSKISIYDVIIQKWIKF